MQNLLCVAFSTLLGTFGLTQQNTVSTGGDGSGTGGTFSYSIGQIDYINVSSTLSISEGVQQPFEYYEVVGLSELNPIVSSIFPNPATESIQLEITQMNTGLSYNLFDLKGELLAREQITELKTSIDVRSLPVGSYVIEVSENLGPITTLKFIKH